jgi:hypothetical protein
MHAASHFVTVRPQTEALPQRKPDLIQVSYCSKTTGVFRLTSIQNQYFSAASAFRPPLSRRFAVFEPVTTLHLLLNGKPITVQEIA